MALIYVVYLANSFAHFFPSCCVCSIFLCVYFKFHGVKVSFL